MKAFQEENQFPRKLEMQGTEKMETPGVEPGSYCASIQPLHVYVVYENFREVLPATRSSSPNDFNTVPPQAVNQAVQTSIC